MMNLRFQFLFAIAAALLISPISARFFPNITSIPPGFSHKPNLTSAWDSFNKLTGCHAGVNLDGLSKMKQYFHRFGYIPDSPENFTDLFDDSLESAVKTYQKNFNLNVTGQLDDRTIRQITLPRCGNADIVNGSTTMNSGKPESESNGTTATRFHTVGKYSFFPGTPRWPSSRRDLTYAFLPNNQLSREVRDVFATAFDRWSEVASLTFTETDNYFTADIRVGFLSGDHGDGEPFDGVLGTLAHAFSPPSGRLHLDGDEDWVVTGLSGGDAALPTAVDLESVAVHEIGHLLGLGHSSEPDAIMFPTISSRTRKVELAQDDIAGVQQLYGSNPNFNGTGLPPMQERDSNAAGDVAVSRWGLGLILTVGLALLLSV
ncbi:Metalloendoproteinase 2-MMP [Linum perenne]